MKIFSRNWVIKSDENFYKVKCFKMLSQDPWDRTIDQYCALNAQTARVACENKLGANGEEVIPRTKKIDQTQRYPMLKITKSYNTLRLLFLVESCLFYQLKHTNRKTMRKNHKQRKSKYLEEERVDSAYPEQEVPNTSPLDK